MITGKDRKNRVLFFSLAFFLVSSFLMFYWGTIERLWHLWSTDGDYSYAFIMPLISGYMIGQKREEIARTALRTNWVGGALFLVFLSISLYGILGSRPSVVHPVMPLMVFAITLFCFGTEMLKVLAFPLAVLTFMIPLPVHVQAQIVDILKLISAHLGVFMIRLYGMPVCIEGSMIDLGIIRLQVADACSGLRYILSLFALSILFAYFFEKVRWKQLVLILTIVPISIVSNGFRVGMTGILVQHCGSEAAQGVYHHVSGWLMFMIAFILLSMAQFGLRAIPVCSLDSRDERCKDGHAHARQSVDIYPVVLCSLLLFLSVILVYKTSL